MLCISNQLISYHLNKNILKFHLPGYFQLKLHFLYLLLYIILLLDNLPYIHNFYFHLTKENL